MADTEGVKDDGLITTLQDLVDKRSDSEITVEATVDTGFEFMAVAECREKFGPEIAVLKERGRIIFNVDRAKYSMVTEMRSVDNLYLIVSHTPSIGLKGVNTAEDLEAAKKQAHVPDWDRWLNVWSDLVGFKGVLKPSPEQFTLANERATKDKEMEKARQAERQQKHKERQERHAKKRAQRQSKDAAFQKQREATQAAKESSEASKDTEVELNKIAAIRDDQDSAKPVSEESTGESNEDAEDKNSVKPLSEDSTVESNKEALDKISISQGEADGGGDDSAALLDPSTEQNTDDESAAPPDPNIEQNAGDDASDSDEVQSLPDYERAVDRDITADIPPNENVLRFRATCFRVGKHTFGSMEVAREFGGELQEKFNWIVDLINFHAEVVLSIHKDKGQVSMALTKHSLHRRNIAFFGPTTLRATVCHNLLRMADIKAGDVVLDPLAGGGSIPIEGAMSFSNAYHLGGDIHPKAVSRAYSNIRCLQEECSRGLALDSMRWDSRCLPLREASVDVIVSDLPFGVRMGNKSNNRNLYRRVLLEMARVTRPGSGRAILLTQDRKSFALGLVGTFGLWWQSRVMAANIGGLDAAVFTLRRTSKIRPEESELAEGPPKEYGNWRGGRGGGQRGWGEGRGVGRGRGRGRPYSRGRRGGQGQRDTGGNWRDHGNPVDSSGPLEAKE